MKSEVVPSLAIYVDPVREKPIDLAETAPETLAAAAPLVESALNITATLPNSEHRTVKQDSQSSPKLESSPVKVDPLVLGAAVRVARHKRIKRENAIRRANSYARAAAVYATAYARQSIR